MKKIYFFLFISFFTKSISAQTYYPMLDSVNTWSYTLHMVGVRMAQTTQTTCTYPVFNTSSFKEITTADTTFNGHTYKTIINNSQVCSLGYIREDTALKKIFFVDNIFSPEKTLYDFAMTPGDTMTINFISNAYGYASGLYTLDSINTIHINAGFRRAFRLSCHAFPASPILTWVESVGNLNDVVYPYFDNQTTFGMFSGCPGEQHEFYQFMICFDHLSKVYYDSCSLSIALSDPSNTSYVDSCDYSSVGGGINEQKAFASMNIFPNPSYGKTTVSLDVKQDGDFKIVVRDISGKKILKEIPLGKIGEGKKVVELDLEFLANGFYLIELQSAQGSVYNKLLIQK